MSDFNISDHADYGAFVPSQLDDYGLDPYEFRIYCRMVRRAGSGKCTEGVERMAKGCRMTPKKARDAIAVLLAIGMIEVESAEPGKPKTYTRSHHARWKHQDFLEDVRNSVLKDRKDTRKRVVTTIGSSRGSRSDPLSDPALPPIGSSTTPPTGSSTTTPIGSNGQRYSLEGTPREGTPRRISPLTPQGENQKNDRIKTGNGEIEPTTVTCQSEVLEVTESVSAIALPGTQKSSAKKSRQSKEPKSKEPKSKEPKSKEPSAAEIEEARLLYNACKPDRWGLADVMNADRVQLFMRMWLDAREQGIDWRDLMRRALAGAKVDPFWGQQVQGTFETLFYKRRYQILAERLSAKGMNAAAIHDSGLSVADIQRAKKAHERPDVSRFVAGIIR